MQTIEDTRQFLIWCPFYVTKRAAFMSSVKEILKEESHQILSNNFNGLFERTHHNETNKTHEKILIFDEVMAI